MSAPRFSLRIIGGAAMGVVVVPLSNLLLAAGGLGLVLWVLLWVGPGWWLSGRRELCSFCFWIEGQVQIGLFVDLLPPNFSSPTFIVFPFNFTILFMLFCWGLHSLCDVPAGRRHSELDGAA